MPIDDEIRRQRATICAHDLLDPAHASERKNGGAGHDLDPVAGVLGGVERRDRRRHDPVHHPLERLEHGHRGAELGQARRHLESDVAAADDDRPRPWPDCGLDRIGIRERAQIEHARQIDTGQRQPAGSRAGADHERRVVECGAVFQDEKPLLSKNSRGAGAEAQIDAVLGVVALGSEPGPLQRHLAAEIRFRQRRPLIGQVRLVAEQGKVALEAQLAQAHGDLRARLPGADDDHPLRHARGCRTAGSGMQPGRQSRMTELCDLSAVELRPLIGAKPISPVELLASCRARVERVNGAVNAFVATCFERAEAEAKAAERAVMAGATLGPLHGLPIGIKDLALTAGLRTTFGSPQFADHVPEADECQVAAVRRAGAIVVGKTNTPEFGAGANTVNSVYGATGNPFDPDKTCAGSSGGSAVALATGMVPLATGSDMGGSLRNPAAYCGVVGFRPSPGAVPHELRLVGWSPLGVQGPMGRTVADAALLFGVMAGTDPRDPLTWPRDPAAPSEPVDLASLRVALSEDLGFAPVDDGIRGVFRRAIAQIRGVFAGADDRDPPLDQSANEAFEVTRAINFLAAHSETYRSRPEMLGPNVSANVEQGLAMSLDEVARAMTAQTLLYRQFLEFMSEYDALLCPAMAVPPFPHAQLYVEEINGERLRTYFHWLALAYGLTLTAHPVACIPCGRDHTGMPFGIQVCGRRYGDNRTLAIAAALERHLQTMPELARPLPDLTPLAA